MAASCFWSELSTTEFAARDWANTTVVAPIAAIEQHGPHLPVGVDAMILQGCVERVVERLAPESGALSPRPPNSGALFLPLMSVGVSTEHRDFPGTLGLSPQTAYAALTEILESAIAAGARKLVILNSHGGNSALMSQVALELRARHGVLVVTVSLARFGVPEGLFGADELRFGIHGGAVETSLMLAFRPELVDMAKTEDFASQARAFERDFAWLRADRPAGFGWMAQDLGPEGALGDARAASAEKGAATADLWAKACVELLDDVARFDLARLSVGRQMRTSR